MSTSKTATDYLMEGAALISERGTMRDQPTGEKTMGRCVKAFWTIYGDAILKRGFMLEEEGWDFMCILKKCRKSYGRFHEDDFIDDLNYAALAAEAASSRENPDG